MSNFSDSFAGDLNLPTYLYYIEEDISVAIVRMMREELIKEAFSVLFHYNNNFANSLLIRGKQNVHRLIDNDGRW